MADLSNMYRLMIESIPQPNDMMRGAAGIQQVMNNGLEYQQARDNYEAMRGLRALFAQNPNPSYQEIGAFSPEYAQKSMLMDLDMREKLQNIRKTDKEMGRIDSQKLEEDAKIWAGIIGPLGEEYLDNPNQDEMRAKLGQLIEQGQRQGLSIAPGFDINQMDARKLLNMAIGRGYPVPPELKQRIEVETQAQKNNLPPPYSPEEVRPQPKFIPETGQTVLQPAPYGGGAQPGPDAWNPGRTAPRNERGHIMARPGSLPPTANVPTFDQVTDVKMLEDIYKQLPNGSPDKIAAGRRLQELMRGNDADASYNDEPDERFASSGEIQKARVKVAGDKAAAEAQAKADVERKEGAENKLTVLESIPPVEKIDALIDQSISSGLEARVKNITSGEFGLENDAVTATESLKTIEGQFKKLTRELAGAGAFSDSEQKMIKDATADVANPRVPVEARKAKMRFVMNMMENAVKKYPDLAQRLKSTQGGASSGIQPGHVEDGYRFKGGDPANPDNWEKQ